MELVLGVLVIVTVHLMVVAMAFEMVILMENLLVIV